MPPAKPAKGEYIETENGNKVSRRSQTHGLTNIILGGRTVVQAEAVIRGDLLRTTTTTTTNTTTTTLPTSANSITSTSSATPVPSQAQAQAPTPTVAVSTGKYTFLSSNSILHPPRKYHRGTFSHTHQKLGDNVYIGPGAVVESATIGSGVWIGAGAVLGRLSFIRDGARVLPGAVVPAGMVVNAGDVVGGRPARKVGEVGWGEGWSGREAWSGVGKG